MKLLPRCAAIGLLFTVLAVFGCDKEPQEVGGTCDSMGGSPCVCPDGAASCTNHRDECVCDGKAIPNAPHVDPDPDPEPRREGGDCSSLGGEPCDCPDGTTSCTNHKDMCLCDGEEIPNGSGPHPEPVKPAPDADAEAVPG